MQGLTRNPLADPGLLGLSGGANRACTDTCFQPFHQLPLLNASLLYWGRSWRNYGIWNWYGEKGGLSPLRIVLAGAPFQHFYSQFQKESAFTSKFHKMYHFGLLGRNWNNLEPIKSYYSSHFN